MQVSINRNHLLSFFRLSLLEISMLIIAISKIQLQLNSFVNGNIKIGIFLVLIVSFIFYSHLYKRNEILIFYLASGYVIIDSLILNNSLGQILGYILFFAVVLITHKIVPQNSFFELFILVGIIFLVQYFRYGKEYNTIYFSSDGLLNPNLLGGMAFIFLVMLGVYLRIKSPKRERLFFLLGCLVVGIFELFMDDQTMLAGSVILYIFSFDKILKWFNSKKLVKLILSILIFGDVILPIVIIRHFKYSDLINLNSIFSGREKIWDNLFVKFSMDKKGILFGLGSNAEQSITSLPAGSAMHNSFYQMILYFGIISVILMMIFFFIQIDNMFENEVNDIQLFSLISFFIFLLMSFTEVLIIHNTFGIYIAFVFGLATNHNFSKVRSI